MIDRRLGRRRGRRLHHPARRRVRGGQILSAQQGRLVRGRLVRARQAHRRRSPSAATSPPASPRRLLREIGRILTTVPADLAIHKTLQRILDAKREMFESGEGFDWATAEALAFGTLLREGHPVRLSGQDSGRGTFSQRHSVWVDQNNGAQIYPADQGRPGPLRGARQPAVRIRRARLRIWLVAGRPADAGPLGGAVRRLRQRRAGDRSTSSSPPARPSGCAPAASCLLLPHGYEGQGPEHSSARPERFLQLCAEDNMQVANCTTPANYFHILRRQMHRDFRKPLVLHDPQVAAAAQARRLAASPISPARAISSASSPIPTAPKDAEVKRLVLCTGKLAYELFEARDKAGDERHLDRPDRAALSVPGRGAAGAAQAHDQPRGGGLGAGGAAEPGLLGPCRAAARAPPRRGRA